MSNIHSDVQSDVPTDHNGAPIPADAANKPEVRHKEFARRLEIACQQNPHVPPLQFGRLVWFQDQFSEKYSVDAPCETVRKWFKGLTRPHPHSKMVQLAEILKVDVAWLATGSAPSVSAKNVKSASRVEVPETSGAAVVDLVRSILTLEGFHVTLPTADDRIAQENGVNLYYSVKGLRYSVHVTLAKKVEGEALFDIPKNVNDAIIVGVVPLGGVKYMYVSLDQGGVTETPPDEDGLRRISLQQIDHKKIASFYELG